VRRVFTAVSSGESGGADYWRQRAYNLGVQVHESLEPDEIVFYERFGAALGRPLGDLVALIPRDRRMKPTNDFQWLTRGGIEVEVKTPMVADYAY
jgi:hypothetical protein